VAYVDLMERCWQRTPSARPAFEQVRLWFYLIVTAESGGTGADGVQVSNELLGMLVAEEIFEDTWKQIQAKSAPAAAAAAPRRAFKFT
jgi:hypothetical protein